MIPALLLSRMKIARSKVQAEKGERQKVTMALWSFFWTELKIDNRVPVACTVEIVCLIAIHIIYNILYTNEQWSKCSKTNLVRIEGWKWLRTCTKDCKTIWPNGIQWPQKRWLPSAWQVVIVHGRSRFFGCSGRRRCWNLAHRNNNWQ